MSPSSVGRRVLRAPVLTLAVLLALLAAMSPAAAAPDAGSRKVLFGATPGGDDGVSLPTALTQMETRIGRTLDFVRVFERWDSNFPNAYHNQVLDGRLMLLSVNPIKANGSALTWREIADAPAGSAVAQKIQQWADRMKAVGEPIWFGFNHEPEAVVNLPRGTSSDYIDAWRRVVRDFRARGADNVEFVWIMTDWAFAVNSSDRRHASKWYPGDAYVDLMAADAYNWSNCRADQPNGRWRSLETVIAPFRDFGKLHPNKPLVLAEWASTEQNGSKAAWLDAVPTLLAQPGWEQFQAVSYFNRIDPNFPNCNFKITSSPAAASAFTRISDAPILAGGMAQPAEDLVFDGRVDATGATAERWRSVTYTPTSSGPTTLTLNWAGNANLRIEVRREYDNAWVAANMTTDRPKSVNSTLTAGTSYRVAVWSMSGAADATVRAYRGEVEQR